jgi:hypothetical protein
MSNNLCIICNNTIIDFLDLSNNYFNLSNINLKLCNNCFHIQSKLENKTNSKYNYKNFNTNNCLFNLICNKIDSKIFQNPIKILNLNDINTNILDNIYTKYKYKYIKTVSLSELFYPSFFSKHTCLKGDLTDWSYEYLKNNFETFDIIILNTTLSFNNNINDILFKCKLLSHENTRIFSTHYDILNIYSHVFILNLNNNIKNIFSTNSLNRLCENNKLLLQNKHKTNKNTSENLINILIYEICLPKHKHDKSSSIIEELCNDMELNLYDENIYQSISKNLHLNYTLFNDIIMKYHSQNYNIVFLDQTDKKFESNINIITNLNNLNINDKYLFITFDYENFQTIYIKLKSYKYEYDVNLSKCLILDTNLLITYPIHN